MQSYEDALARQAAQVRDSVLRREMCADDRRKRQEGRMIFSPKNWKHCGKI
jgi:hypothetical protein